MQPAFLLLVVFLLELCDSVFHTRKVCSCITVHRAGTGTLAECEPYGMWQAARLNDRAAELLLLSKQAKQQAAAINNPAEFAQSARLQRKAVAYEKAADSVRSGQVSCDLLVHCQDAAAVEQSVRLSTSGALAGGTGPGRQEEHVASCWGTLHCCPVLPARRFACGNGSCSRSVATQALADFSKSFHA